MFLLTRPFRIFNTFVYFDVIKNFRERERERGVVSFEEGKCLKTIFLLGHCRVLDRIMYFLYNTLKLAKREVGPYVTR